MLDLASHHGLRDAFLLEGLDQPRKLAQREPMYGDASIRLGTAIHLGVGFFLDGRHHDGVTLRSRRIEQQERKSAVAGYEAEFHRISLRQRNRTLFLHRTNSKEQRRVSAYLITPRSLRSINRTSSATSSPASSRIFSTAWVVFSFAASSRR